MAEIRYLVCGGCGFIGSNFARRLHGSQPEASITIFDLLTYAGSLDNLGDLRYAKPVSFIQGDIAGTADLEQLSGQEFDLVINFAAETHVDRSLYFADRFAESNVVGVVKLLRLCRRLGTPFLQVSTDEVYGPALPGQRFDESAPLAPSSPYAASKAAADLMVLSAIKTFRQPAAIVRTCNIYGPRQFPEKLIPLLTHLAASRRPLPIYGDGRQRRCWLYIEDFCRALMKITEDFPTGEILNIGSEQELENLEIAKAVKSALNSASEINFVDDRPAHDRAYRLDSSRYHSRYGEIKRREFRRGLQQTIDWYLANNRIFDRLQESGTAAFLERHYGRRGQ
jgi:dTDP-glucose 4,6-dehydratase